MGGFFPRFVVEVAFLGLLAAATPLAELGSALIVAGMAAGWLIVTGIEILAWRQERRPSLPPRPAQPPPPPPAADWDLDELLRPLPGEEGEAGEETRVLPPEER